jgi:hypothetical protein
MIGANANPHMANDAMWGFVFMGPAGIEPATVGL